MGAQGESNNDDQAPGIETRAPLRGRQLTFIAGTIGLGGLISGLLIERVLSSFSLDWRVDAAMAWMAILLLAPAGPAWIGSAALLFARRFACSRSNWLWFFCSVVELAWCGVLFDNGARIGPVGKLLSGATAFFGTPALAASASIIGVRAAFTPTRRRDLWLWTGVVLSLVTGAGWGFFLWVLLPLRF